MLFAPYSVYGRVRKHTAPRGHFVRPAMIFGNFEIINI